MNTDNRLTKARNDATAIFDAGVQAVAPDTAVNQFCYLEGSQLSVGEHCIDLDNYRSIYIIGAGKATAPMAAAMEDILGHRLTDGVITVKHGHTAPLKSVKTVEASHPVPDAAGEAGSKEILAMAEGAGPDDLCLCLISGGGSALMPLAADGVTLEDKQATTRILLGCGATIHEINTLRKHLSAIKGGQLAKAAAPATVVSLLLSDVVGDDLDVIASGSTVPDRSTFGDCLAIVTKYGIADDLPGPVMTRLNRGVDGHITETPKPGDDVFARARTIVIGSNLTALKAAEAEAKKRGYATLILSSLIEGETADVAGVHAAIAREIAQSGHPLSPPVCVLSGGETTVTITGAGKGGRNQHLCLCAAAHLDGPHSMVLLSGGTDGNDGPTDAAGAIADNTTLARAAALNLDIAATIAANDAYPFFEKLGDLLITGPTNTNVMDLRLIVVP